MTINYLPSKIISRFTSKREIQSLINDDLTVNKRAIRNLVEGTPMAAKDVEQTVRKVLASYRNTYKEDIAAGMSKRQALQDALKRREFLVQRVQNLLVAEIANAIKLKYRGETYIWLPSSAEEPDPEHQLKYGKRYRIGRGEMPGDRYGCKCGMSIQVESKRLELT